MRSPCNHRGTIECRGRKWFLRVAAEQPDQTTGEITRRRKRIELGTTGELRTHAAARAAADRWLSRTTTQTLNPGPTILAVNYFSEFLRRTVSMWRASSARHYRSVITHHLMPAFTGALTDIDAVAFRELMARLVRSGRKRHTIANVRRVLLHVLSQAVRDGYGVHRIVPADVRLPSEIAAPRAQRWVTSQELDAILDASDWPWRALWAVLGHLGLRISEALGLCWEHIDLTTRVVCIRQSAVLGTLQPPKTKTSVADLPMPDGLVDILTAYQRVWKPNKDGLLFATRNATPLRAEDVRTRQLNPMLRQLNLPPAGFHAFRHGLPRRLLLAGVSPAIVQKLLRHASLSMTEKYIHTSGDDLRAAIQAGVNRKARTDQLQTTTDEVRNVPS